MTPSGQIKCLGLRGVGLCLQGLRPHHPGCWAGIWGARETASNSSNGPRYEGVTQGELPGGGDIQANSGGPFCLVD